MGGRVVGAADELRAWSAQMAKGIRLADVEAVVEESAVEVQKQLRAEARGSAHFGQIAPRITHETTQRYGGPEAQIGPEKRGAGRLANIAYFGGRNGGGGTLPDPQGAGDAAASVMIRKIADLATEALQ